MSDYQALPEPPENAWHGGGYGELHIPPNILVEVFGPPHKSNRTPGAKITGEYYFIDDLGQICHLYDWKQTNSFYDDHELPSEFWTMTDGVITIGGKPENIPDFAIWIIRHLREHCHLKFSNAIPKALDIRKTGDVESAHAILSDRALINASSLFFGTVAKPAYRATYSTYANHPWKVDSTDNHLYPDFERWEQLRTMVWKDCTRNVSKLGFLWRLLWKFYPGYWNKYERLRLPKKS